MQYAGSDESVHLGKITHAVGDSLITRIAQVVLGWSRGHQRCQNSAKPKTLISTKVYIICPCIFYLVILHKNIEYFSASAFLWRRIGSHKLSVFPSYLLRSKFRNSFPIYLNLSDTRIASAPPAYASFAPPAPNPQCSSSLSPLQASAGDRDG